MEFAYHVLMAARANTLERIERSNDRILLLAMRIDGLTVRFLFESVSLIEMVDSMVQRTEAKKDLEELRAAVSVLYSHLYDIESAICYLEVSNERNPA